MTSADRLCEECVTEGCLQPSSPLVERRADLCDCCGFFVNAGPTMTPAEERMAMPKRWQVMALARNLWKEHGHPGQTCLMGPPGPQVFICNRVDKSSKQDHP